MAFKNMLANLRKVTETAPTATDAAGEAADAIERVLSFPEAITALIDPRGATRTGQNLTAGERAGGDAVLSAIGDRIGNQVAAGVLATISNAVSGGVGNTGNPRAPFGGTNPFGGNFTGATRAGGNVGSIQDLLDRSAGRNAG